MTATRLRRTTYGERARFCWRLPEELYTSISNAAIAANSTTTAFVLRHLMAAAEKPVSARQMERFEQASFLGQMVAVTLRLEGDDLALIRKSARSAGMSTNRFMVFIAWRTVGGSRLGDA